MQKQWLGDCLQQRGPGLMHENGAEGWLTKSRCGVASARQRARILRPAEAPATGVTLGLTETQGALACFVAAHPPLLC